MLNRLELAEIKNTTKEFFDKMGFEVEIEIGRQVENTIPVNLKTEEPKILIGEGGRTLAEIQHLLKVILKRKIKELFFIDLDVADYKKKKYQFLKEMARSAADEVALSKKERMLSPMSAAERRIIHLELGDRTNVTTESIGREPERSVAIRPYP